MSYLTRLTAARISPKFRNYSGKAEHSGKEAESHDGGIMHNVHFWSATSKVGAFLLACASLFVYMTNKHGHSSDVHYPFLRKREKPFPWGDGDTSLFNQFRKDKGKPLWDRPPGEHDAHH